MAKKRIDQLPAMTAPVAGDLYVSEQSGTAKKVTWGHIKAWILSAGSIVSSMIADGAIVNAKIGAGAVGTAKIADGAVTNPKLATNAVGETNILDGSVTNSKIAANSIGGGKIMDGAISNSKLAANAVDNSKITDGTISRSKLAHDCYGYAIGSPTFDSNNYYTILSSDIGKTLSVTQAKTSVRSPTLWLNSDVCAANIGREFEVAKFNGDTTNTVIIKAGNGVTVFCKGTSTEAGYATISMRGGIARVKIMSGTIFVVTGDVQ